MAQPDRPIYLDCAATTPIDPRVRDIVLHYMEVEFGNSGSRTHIYGQEAAKGVKKAREQVAAVVDARTEEVVFTSGATEANNLAILGLMEYGRKTGRRHILSTQIEHKAVLEPLHHMVKSGFDVELIPPLETGAIDPEEVAQRLRSDTLLVSVMHVNNETGAIQPINELCEALKTRDALFHVDAAQGFGKEIDTLRNHRIDLLSVSSHKIHGPKGIGCLVSRTARKARRRLSPLILGGGQESGLRAGTAPTPLICGFGKAATLAYEENQSRILKWEEIETQLLSAFNALPVWIHCKTGPRLKNTLCVTFDDVDSEAIILSLRDIVSLSTGSACTSESFQESHVLRAMYKISDAAEIPSAVRFSWSHMTPNIPTQRIIDRVKSLL